MEDSQFKLSIKSKSSIYFVEELNSLSSFLYEKYDLVIVDNKVFKSHNIRITGPLIQINSTEKAKEYKEIIEIFELMLSLGLNRSSKVLAIGGGVIQDIVTFASSLYFRGIEWDFMPTTLLAMGDSCIGGKSSINFNSTKNVIGNFHPPGCIYLYVGFLKTLNESNLKSGIGELYHYAFLNKVSDFNWYNRLLGKGFSELTSFDYQALVHRTLNIKKEIIEEDEFDKARRLFNNWGHTIGHAIETVSNFKIPHGQAVLAGISLELKLLKLVNKKSYEKYQDIVNLIISEYGYDNLPDFNCYDLFNIIKKDKKNLPGKIAIVNLKEIEKIELLYVEESVYLSYLKIAVQ